MTNVGGCRVMHKAAASMANPTHGTCIELPHIFVMAASVRPGANSTLSARAALACSATTGTPTALSSSLLVNHLLHVSLHNRPDDVVKQQLAPSANDVLALVSGFWDTSKIVWSLN